MKGFMKGLLVGSTIGGLITLFTTKKPGKTQREELKAQLKATTEKIADVKDSYQEFTQQQQRLTETVQTLVPEFQESLTKDIEKFQFQTKPRIERIKEQVSTLQKHLGK